MLVDTILAIIIGFLTIFIPGILFAFALLKNTKLHIVEIGILGFIFGFIALPSLTWLEAYLMNTIHFFTFSLILNYVNFAILTIIGLILCIWQGVFKDFKKNFLDSSRLEENKMKMPKWAWYVFILIIASVFITRFMNISVSPTFYEFDPYFDMISTQYILTYGQQIPFDHAAWPAIATGVNHRMEPLIPYIEAYWYDIANSLGPHLTTLNITMLGLVSGYYPAIAAVLLTFVIFMILYHEYDWRIGLIGAGLSATMPVLITTFIAGEQLLEPWGIFAMFFFIAAYVIAVKDMKSRRLAILASIAFIANFIGAHYYTVTVAIFALYILLQGLIDFIRNDTKKEFYVMNGIIIAITIIFFIFYYPYGSTLQNRTPTALGIPSPISYPLFALIFVALLQYLPSYLNKHKIIFKSTLTQKQKYLWLFALIVLALAFVMLTSIRKSVEKYLALSVHFVTPSTPLFMTVQEYAPTGFLYNFGAQGLGIIATSIAGVPIVLWTVIIIAVALLIIKIIDTGSKTSILYLAISIPLLLAGFSEVKYLPHFGVAYILLFSIMIGELISLADRNFNISIFKKSSNSGIANETQQTKNNYLKSIILAVGIFAVSSILAIIYLIYIYLKDVYKDPKIKKNILYFIVFLIIIMAIVEALSTSFVYGESSSYMDLGGTAIVAFTTPQSALWDTNVCNALFKDGYQLGAGLFCNQIPSYWLNSMYWIRDNVGPNAPRVLSWWDYGDWINWFGNSYAVLRGDNADPSEDYAVAAQYVLGSQDNYTPKVLANYMNGNQIEYALFDEDLMNKWGALDFLACIHANETNYTYALKNGLGTSQCELQHDPQYAIVPLQALYTNSSNFNVNYYCNISTSSHLYAIAIMKPNSTIANSATECLSLTPNANGAYQFYTTTGKATNSFLYPTPMGEFSTQSSTGGNVTLVEFMVLYAPNANGIITDAPTKYYTSNYYKAFFLGNLPGFTQVYPTNATSYNGINFINYTYPVRIFKLNNYTGGLPPSTQKPPWVKNNYSIPA
ncbi:MAG: hypothetical protein ACP5T6_02015 [Candidatus Micrarchaeia archaeon]